MSNIYISEQPSYGKVILNTTCGEIVIELWAKEAPMACKNFVQLCMEGYYDRTIFHRVVKNFIIQGGDPTGTGEGEDSIYGGPFKTEIHSRLRFNRRGLVAMSCFNNKVNGSQFFFTLKEAPELQGNHTIIGSVVGKSIYNMVNLGEGLINKGTDRPLCPKEIISTTIIFNPFDDIIPRIKKTTRDDLEDDDENFIEIKSKGKSKKRKNKKKHSNLSSEIVKVDPNEDKDCKERIDKSKEELVSDISKERTMENDESTQFEIKSKGKSKKRKNKKKHSNLSSEIVEVDPNEQIVLPEIKELAPVIIEKQNLDLKDKKERIDKLKEKILKFQKESVFLSSISKERTMENDESTQSENRIFQTMVKIGTHNGTFHCDEVLACFLLKQLPMYKESEIIRTREPTILSNCDIVVDVGGVFDPKKKKFDHHQKTFNETFKTLVPEKPWDIKLSSAGLIYVYFGKEILTEICKQYETNIDINVLYDKMYEHFVLEIDAIDNGISVCDGVPRYAISTLSSRVSHINPRWNEKSIDENACFEKAMKLVGSEFIDKVDHYVNCWSARELVQKAIDDRYSVHESGLILKFENGGFPWKSHFFDLEKNMLESGSDSRSIKNTIGGGDDSQSKKNLKDSGDDDQSKKNLKESNNDDQSKTNMNESGDDDHSKKNMKESGGAVTLSPYQIRFVLFSDGKMWRVQCIPLSEKQGFINRLGLLEEWRGISDEELCTLSCIPDSVFVHANGFIGGNKSYDGALKMAVKTLEHAKLI